MWNGSVSPVGHPPYPRPAPAQEGSADEPRHCQGSVGSVGSAGSRDILQHPWSMDRDPFRSVKWRLLKLRRVKTKLLSLLRSLLFSSHRAIKSHPGGQSCVRSPRAVPTVPELSPQSLSCPRSRSQPGPCGVCSAGMRSLLSALGAACAQLRLPGTVDAPVQPRAQPSRRFSASIPDTSPRARGMSRECSRCSRAAAGRGRAVKSMMGEF